MISAEFSDFGPPCPHLDMIYSIKSMQPPLPLGYGIQLKGFLKYSDFGSLCLPGTAADRATQSRNISGNL